MQTIDDVPNRVPTIHHRLSAVTSSPSLMRASAEPFTPLIDKQQLILTRDTSTRHLLLPPPPGEWPLHAQLQPHSSHTVVITTLYK